MGAATFDLSKLGEDGVQEGIEAKVLKDGKERGDLRFDVSFYPVLKPQKIDGGKEEELPEISFGIKEIPWKGERDVKKPTPPSV